jgi:hypothetical protein
MEHHLRVIGNGVCWDASKIDGIGGIARKAAFIKDSMTGDDEALVHRIPKAPCLYPLRITHKNALLGVRLQSLSLPSTYQDICQATKHSEVRDVWFLPLPMEVGSLTIKC